MSSTNSNMTGGSGGNVWTTTDKPENILSCDSLEEYNNVRSELEGWTLRHTITGTLRGFLVHVPPSINCDDIDTDTTQYPILLAFHGFTGRPQQEIVKWKTVANQNKIIIVAPHGSSSGETGDQAYGWNAVDCCGYPAEHELDDLGFAKAVMDIIRAEMPLADASQVVASGFSNGGFFVSLLGLQSPRPEWLKGIVPTGGYQYDTSLYDGSMVDPLPVFAHHGGSDAIVHPGGCCRSSPGNETTPATSNCPLDIGIKRDTCLSFDSSFQLWVNNINGCTDIQTLISEEGATCSSGVNCRNGVITKMCLWPDAVHSWGDNMPGTEMVGEFITQILFLPPTPTGTGTPTVAAHKDDNGETLAPSSADTMTSGATTNANGASNVFMIALVVTLVIVSIFAAGKPRIPSFSYERQTRSTQHRRVRKKSTSTSVDGKYEEEMVELINSS